MRNLNVYNYNVAEKDSDDDSISDLEEQGPAMFSSLNHTQNKRSPTNHFSLKTGFIKFLLKPFFKFGYTKKKKKNA